MSTEIIKLELMNWIGDLSDKKLLDQLYRFKKQAESPLPHTRQPGWGKDFFIYVAPDFDDTPEGFEEYTPDNI